MESQHDTTDCRSVCRLTYKRAAVAENYDRVEAALRRLPGQRVRQLLKDIRNVDIQEALRKAIAKSEKTHYRLGKDAELAPEIIDRFVSGERDITLGTAAKLAETLGLQLIPKPPRKRKS